MTIVERVAKATFDEFERTFPERVRRKWDANDGAHIRRRYRSMALAALREIRIPTEGMLKAGDIPGWDDSVTIGLSEEIWKAMVDAAIAEAGGQE